jgi:pimeloyl-ACP methyl ester carboxylesterase
LSIAACALGTRVIAIDRPGIGLSDPVPARSLLSWTDDVAALADALGIDRFAILGVSAGGPYALACAHRLAKRITKIGVVGGLGPCHEAWVRRGVRLHGRVAFWMVRHAPWLLWPTFGLITETAMIRFPHAAYGAIAAGASRPDRVALARAPVRAKLLDSLSAAMCQGSAGALQDLRLFANPWGFQLQEIGVSVTFWHGEADHVVPTSHTRFHAMRLPLASARYLRDEGHFSLPINHAEDILRGLMPE